MAWIKDIVDPKTRGGEEFYRNRWQHDTAARSTHGVNCTGGCSWMVYVKDGIVTWEMQALDYPLLEREVPPYEPRGCQRGISASWYVYSPIRVKYPYIRGALLDLWSEARAAHDDPVEAWESIMADEDKRQRFQRARGKGGFRRATWDEALEIAAAASLSTARRYGPDRVFGFSPIPAMSYLSYAGGSRFLQLFGGVNLSFYDWYADLPNAFPEVWGDQTDVCESADWYKAKFIAVMGANLSMTRTPDVHFISEARHEGTKLVVFSPDFSQVAKYADWWIPIKAGQDMAFWLAVDHVILSEFHAARQVPYFVDYLKRYTDSPFLVRLDGEDGGVEPGRYLRSNLLAPYADEENGDWKLLVWDATSGRPRLPKGQVGHRWTDDKGKWNLLMEHAVDGTPLDPELTFLDRHDAVLEVPFHEFATGTDHVRGVPVRYVETSEGRVAVATVYDLLMARFGVGRGLSGAYPETYDDAEAAYTPAWQEQYTGIARDTVIRFAREFAANAERTKGRSMVIIGAGINHWYNNNLHYRAPITALLLCGCCGVNGGGMNHYVGQEKLTLMAPWSSLAFARDWHPKSRLQQTPMWHYVNSDQWRYDPEFTDYDAVPPGAKWAKGHAVDLAAKAVRLGWMPYYPQFDQSPLEVGRDAKGEDDVAAKVAAGEVSLAVEDPDKPENWPRVWFIWRGNALLASAKGHEFFLRHYLGTHDNSIAGEDANGKPRTVRWREPAPRGKMDLVVDINFRMDTSALYSDIVLPAASWYEKNDLNTTDLHSFVHPLSAAVPPVWETRSDWDTFRSLAKKVSELAPAAFPNGPVRDVVMQPLAHDTPDELAQLDVLDWRPGEDGVAECEPVAGKTMPHFSVTERDYSQLYDKFVSLGPLVRENGISANGVHLPVAAAYDELLQADVGGSPDPRRVRCVEWGGSRYPALEDAYDAANVILALAPESNGELAYAAFAEEEKQIGLPLTDLAEATRGVRMTFAELKIQPRRTLTTPTWTGLVNDGRTYAAWTLNVERLVPWRTLTGRQHLYLDHPVYLDFGQALPGYKPKLGERMRDLVNTAFERSETLVVNYLTPHGKWHIHSTYGDTQRMTTLSRGVEPCWINDKDAASVGLVDNDWVEVFNDNGVMVTRAAVSSRVQRGTCMIYHSPERTLSVPKSQVRGGRRAGGHNSLTRTRINPVLLAGGQAQFTYGFNYWGPTGFNRDTVVVIKKLDRLEW